MSSGRLWCSGRSQTCQLVGFHAWRRASRPKCESARPLKCASDLLGLVLNHSLCLLSSTSMTGSTRMTCAGTGPLQINRPAASSPAPEPHRTIKDLETGSQHLDGCLASAHGAIQVVVPVLLAWAAAACTISRASGLQTPAAHVSQQSTVSMVSDSRATSGSHQALSLRQRQRHQEPSAFLPQRVRSLEPSTDLRKTLDELPLAKASRGFFRSATPQQDLTMNEVLAYRFQQIITGSTATKLGFVLLLCMPYVLASATFYRSLSSESWFQAIYKTYCTLFRTPGSVNRETAAGPAIVLNIVFLYGFLFFAVFLGLITQDIKDQMNMLREGATPVAQTGHTVICHWNESTPALLRQLASAQRGRRTFGDWVVILADRDKKRMDSQISQEVSQKVVVPYSIETRRGFPQSVADLRRVRINAASNVFVMQPDGNTMATPKGQSSGRLATLTELNAIKTATALHVSAMSGPHMDQKMVIQDSGSPFKTVGYMERFQEGISMAGELRPQELQYALQPLGEEVMTSLTAQCACRPGLVRVVDTLFTHDPAKEQLHFALDDNMVGERFGDVRRRVRGAVVLGVKHGDNAHVGTQLNPPDETIIGPKDELLLLAKPNKVSFQLTPAISDATVDAATEWMRSEQSVQARIMPRRVIVLNWTNDVEPLVEAFADFSPPGSEVVFVHQQQQQCKIPKKVRSVRFRQVVAKTHLDAQAMMDAGYMEADAVVFGPDPTLADSVYDAQLVADVMVLQQLYATAGCSQRLHLVAPARDPFTAPVVNHVLMDFGAAQQRLSKVDPETRESNFSQALNKSIGDGSMRADLTFGSRKGPAEVAGTLELEDSEAATAAAQERLRSIQALNRRLAQNSEDLLPLQHVITAELYMPRDFAASLLVHVAQEPALINVLQELFNHKCGSSIRLRSAQHFHLDPNSSSATVTFGWLEEAARVRGETALGIMTREGEVTLAPSIDYAHRFRPGDRIAVIAPQKAGTGT